MSVLTKLKSPGPGEGAKDVRREALRGTRRGARRGAKLGAIRGSGQAVAKKAQRKSASVRDRVRTQASEVSKGFARPKRRSRGKVAAVIGAIGAAGAATAYFFRDRIAALSGRRPSEPYPVDQPTLVPTDGATPAEVNGESAQQPKAKA
jgi:hypothetical protein